MTLPALPTNPSTRQVVTTVNAMLQGRTNAVGSLTLQASATTTTVLDPRVGPGSVVLLVPTSANAAADAPWVSHRGDGTFTITHADAGTTDRDFAFVVFG